MSTKDYKEIAKILREAEYLTHEQKRILANQLGYYFENDNPRFKSGMFTAAATSSK